MRPFLPIRFLNLLPLSHMFGQAMATFVPPMLPGQVLFTRSYAPEEIVRQIRTRRISVLVCVPKMLEVLRDHVARLYPETIEAAGPKMHWARRWWHYRRVHRAFGLKFWAFVVGAAPLDPALEAFWGRIGLVVVQGYGLTETAPIVTLNHPLRAARGAVGKPISGVEVRIAGDGEILVRGENVTRGYFNAPEETSAAFRDGWFHTGDVGELDDEGQLHIRGRKKEMIVTPEGLNVFPEDVERALNAQPGVRDSAVVGGSAAGSTAERVHAILVVEPAADVDAIVRGANGQLGDHQKIRSAVVWPERELPRTEGTRKLKRRELRQWLAGQHTPAGPVASGRTVGSVLDRFSPGRAVTGATTIDELGLSSLERVELMMALEEAFQVTIDESSFAAAKTVGDLEGLTRPLQAGEARPIAIAEPIDFPAWNRSWGARTLRRASLPTWILPLARIFMRLDVQGLEHLAAVQGPVLFAANHQSHLDTPAILQALPPRWRYRVAPAMAKEFFKAHFFPAEHQWKARATNSANYYLASLFFNAFPLPQRESRHAPDAALYWRACHRRLLRADLPRRPPHRRGKHRRVPTGGRHGGGQARHPGDPGPNRWPRSHTAPHVEVPGARQGPGRLRPAGASGRDRLRRHGRTAGTGGSRSVSGSGASGRPGLPGRASGTRVMAGESPNTRFAHGGSEWLSLRGAAEYGTIFVGKGSN